MLTSIGKDEVNRFIWDGIWNKHPYSESDLRHRKAKHKFEQLDGLFDLKNILLPQNAGCLLEVGCGMGTVSAIFGDFSMATSRSGAWPRSKSA